MADYKVSILAQLEGFEAIQAKLNALEKNPINMNIQAGQADMNNMVKQYGSSGVKAGNTFAQNFGKTLTASTKTPAYKQFATQQAKQIKDIQQAGSKTRETLADNGLKITQRQSEGIVKNYSKQMQNAAKVAQKQAQADLKAVRTAQADTDKARVQQRIAEMQATAKANNAYHNSVVQQGKQRIAEMQNIQNQARKINEYYDKGYADRDIVKADSKLSRNQSVSGTTEYQNASQYVNQAKNFDSQIKSGNLNMQQTVDTWNQRADALERNGVQMDILNTKQNDLVKTSARFNKANSVDKYIANNTRMGKENTQVLSALSSELRNTNVSKARMESINSEIAGIKGNIEASGMTGKSIFSEIGRGFKQIGQFALTYGGIQKGIQTVQQMASEVVKVDSAMTELRKVSDASDSDIQNYLGEATTSAKEYGVNINEVINSTADWSRLGFQLPDAKELSDATTLLQTVGDNMTQESSAEGLISTIKGFNLEADKAMEIVSSANEVANTQPIDTQGIFAALQRSASSLSVAGNTYQESMALATAGEQHCLINMETYFYRTHLTARAA